MLMNQPMLRDVFERGRTVDLAFLSVGELAAASTMTTLSLINREEVSTLKDSGAVGDVCSHWIDANGDLVDHPLNGRAVGLPPQYLRDVPRVILVSGGKAKLLAMHGALVARYANVLVTDEQTAQQLLTLKQKS
jgi:DNA-binding transcriptional regulator LsrR (DeoR family)